MMFFILFRQTGGNLQIRMGNGQDVYVEQASSFLFSSVFFSDVEDAKQYAEDAITYFIDNSQDTHNSGKEYYLANRDYWPMVNFINHFSGHLFLSYEILTTNDNFDQLLSGHYGIGSPDVIQSFTFSIRYRFDQSNRLYLPFNDTIEEISLWDDQTLNRYQKSTSFKHQNCFDFVYSNDINLRRSNFLSLQHSYHTKSFHRFNQNHILQYILEKM